MHFQTLLVTTNSSDVGFISGLISNEYKISGFNFIESNPDFLLIERGETSISIADVKTLSNWASRRPFQSKLKILIILQAEKMTVQAQNSMLKLIEEPPAHTLLVLQTPNRMSLLPTITSRTRQVNSLGASKGESLPKADNVEQFVSGNLRQRFEVIEQLLKQDPSRERIGSFIESIHRIVNVSNGIDDIEIRKNMLKSIRQALIGIRTGTNTRLTLETLAISMKEQT